MKYFWILFTDLFGRELELILEVDICNAIENITWIIFKYHLELEYSIKKSILHTIKNIDCGSMFLIQFGTRVWINRFYFT